MVLVLELVQLKQSVNNYITQQKNAEFFISTIFKKMCTNKNLCDIISMTKKCVQSKVRIKTRQRSC